MPSPETGGGENHAEFVAPGSVESAEETQEESPEAPESDVENEGVSKEQFLEAIDAMAEVPRMGREGFEEAVAEEAVDPNNRAEMDTLFGEIEEVLEGNPQADKENKASKIMLEFLGIVNPEIHPRIVDMASEEEFPYYQVDATFRRLARDEESPLDVGASIEGMSDEQLEGFLEGAGEDLKTYAEDHATDLENYIVSIAAQDAVRKVAYENDSQDRFKNTIKVADVAKTGGFATSIVEAMGRELKKRAA